MNVLILQRCDLFDKKKILQKIDDKFGFGENHGKMRRFSMSKKFSRNRKIAGKTTKRTKKTQKNRNLPNAKRRKNCCCPAHTQHTQHTRTNMHTRATHKHTQHHTAARPQKQDVAVCRPAPLRCTITQFTMYLRGIFNSISLCPEGTLTIPTLSRMNGPGPIIK